MESLAEALLNLASRGEMLQQGEELIKQYSNRPEYLLSLLQFVSETQLPSHLNAQKLAGILLKNSIQSSWDTQSEDTRRAVRMHLIQGLQHPTPPLRTLIV